MNMSAGLLIVLFFAGAQCSAHDHDHDHDHHHISRRSAMYTGGTNHPIYSCLLTLSKPGEGCDLHPAYPNTIQCAETRRCIGMSQYKDGKCDCCGPEVDCATCYDHSDENRVPPPGDPKYCEKHGGAFKRGLTFQCATRPEICLTLREWNNARCDCCPEVDGNCCHANCTDHSDEECMANEWSQKFTCDGNCISLGKLDDSATDCTYHCVESNKDARKACEVTRRDRDQQEVEARCDHLRRDHIPYYRCPSGAQKCIELSDLHDGKPDCEHGEDEDTTRHPFCDDATKASVCNPGTYECVSVDKGNQYYCRCRKGSPNSCIKSP